MQLLCILAMVAVLTPAALPIVAQTQKPKPAPAPAGESQKAKTAPAKAGAARTIEMTGGDDMKFSLQKIQAKPGETLRIVLKSVGTLPKVAMAHNVVVLRLGADPTEFNKQAMTARATDFVPPALKDQVVAATALAGPGETVEVTFKVPAKAGTYPYMCTFPGHFQAGMRGDLVVK